MYLIFNNRRAKCLRLADAGKKAEYYMTWRVSSEEETGETILHQGFSLKPKFNDGIKFSIGQEIELDDPKFKIKLPELEEDKEKKIFIDLIIWESDDTTREVKKSFTDSGVQKLIDIYSKSNGKKKETLEEYKEWLEKFDETALSEHKKSIEKAISNVPFVKVAVQTIQLIKAVMALFKLNADDFCGVNRVELNYSKKNGKYEYRWNVNEGIESNYEEKEDRYYYYFDFFSSTQRNWVKTKSYFQITQE